MEKSASRSNVRIWGLFVLAGVMSLATTVRAQSNAAYSNKNLRGTYVFKTLGWNHGSSGSAALGDSLGPFNALGSLTADGTGNLTGNETINIMYNSNGTPTTASACADNSTPPTVAICVNTHTGTYTINPDGSDNWTIIKTPIPGSRKASRCREPVVARGGMRPLNGTPGSDKLRVLWLAIMARRPRSIS